MSNPAPILAVKGVSKSFGGVHAIMKASLDIFPGEVVALAGDNGAGKSTLIKAISGVFHYDEGDIYLDGKRIAFATPQEARDNGIETIYQDLALADNLTIGDNIFLGREPMKKLFGFLPVIDRPHMAKVAQETMHKLDFHVIRRSPPFRAASVKPSPSAGPCTGTPAWSSWTSRRRRWVCPNSAKSSR